MNSQMCFTIRDTGVFFFRIKYSGVPNSQTHFTISAVEKISGVQLLVAIDIMKNRCSTVRFSAISSKCSSISVLLFWTPEYSHDSVGYQHHIITYNTQQLLHTPNIFGIYFMDPIVKIAVASGLVPSTYFNNIPLKVTLDISGSPVETHLGSWKYPG